MGELLAAAGWAVLDPWLADLRSLLPDEYYIATELVVQGVPLGCVVVGPQGLVVLHTKDWRGVVKPVPQGPWLEQRGDGEQIAHFHPSQEFAEADAALVRFFADEFPALQPAIWHWVVLLEPSAVIEIDGELDTVVLKLSDVAKRIVALDRPGYASPLDDALRPELAIALQQRQLTRTQRASEPFVFRSGDKAWTITEVAAYMERNPDDGVYHLRNGTLGHWFAAEGAEHLALLAREVMQGPQRHARVPLESFMVRSGLARRRPPVPTPSSLEIDNVLAGDSANRRLVITAGHGSGFLDGALSTTQPWLQVTPRLLTGTRGELLVTADSEGLLPRDSPHDAHVVFESSVTGVETVVPVRLRVRPAPSRLVRRVVRPAAGLLWMGLLGALVGGAQGLWGIRLPAGLARAVPPAVFWGALVGLVWAVCGALRGRRQPAARPLGLALVRHMVRTTAWCAALGLATGAVLWGLRVLSLDRLIANGGFSAAVPVGLVGFAVALGIVPATVGEIASGEDPADEELSDVRRLRRPLRVAVASVALALVLTAGASLAGPALQRIDADATRVALSDWGAQQWERFEARIDTLWHGFQLRYYDRRAPLEPTAQPVNPEGGV